MRGLWPLLLIATALALVSGGCARSRLSDPDARWVHVAPPSPQSYPGLTSYTRTATFMVNALGNPIPPEPLRRIIGFNVRWEASINYERHEGRLAVIDTGHRPLSLSIPSSHVTVLVPGPPDHTYRTYPLEGDPRCYKTEWAFQPSRFEEAYGAVDIFGTFKDNYALIDEQDRMALIPLGPVEVNGIMTDHYRLDPGPTLETMRKRYPHFDGTLSGEVWVAQGGSALVKAAFRFKGLYLPAVRLPFVSSMMEGTIEMTHEIADLNSVPPVTLQRECQSKTAPRP